MSYESSSRNEKVPQERFKYPDIEAERGEFERVAATFNLDADTLMFLAKEEGFLTPLTEEIWEKLENTDSNTFNQKDTDAWDKIKECCEAQDQPRDWQKFKKLEGQGIAVDAPIILKYEDHYHKVAGNTRLMVARALGITPQALMFEYKHDTLSE